jgi:Spy/CpxP family protein refolding chaperone
MNAVWRMLAVAGLAALVAAPALAQPPRGGRGFAGPGGSLLTNKSVQQELKLTDDQMKKIETATQEVRQKHAQDFEALQGLDQQERREKMRELTQKVASETKTALAGILKPEQEKRFKQIELQARGARGFAEADVQKALKLTPEQEEKIKTINDDAQQEMRSLFQGGGGGGGPNPEAQKKMAEMRKETMTKVMAVLTDDQKKEWKEMIGDPFEIKFERGQGRRGGGGGGR